MSTAMNFGSKSFKPRPPDKGAFPLDHFGECSAFKERFMECLRHSGYESGACRQRAMAYLECRMERQVGARPRPGGGEGQPGGPRGGEAAGLPLRGGEGNPQGRRSCGRLLSL
ncbi:cytochrome c oxidase assembly protein COX19 isoform X1 [Harpia harpyja]|uniref:cytochrome c oxidase assembly protein COX19 isoform X1 n=1 Tax=Harpia harpyja TaxID=202280 RepID=UPI0022B134A0|nr:cytochrome c oxidase assembly protein COX19 isoform X1 [Harpia harpyja]